MLRARKHELDKWAQGDRWCYGGFDLSVSHRHIVGNNYLQYIYSHLRTCDERF